VSNTNVLYEEIQSQEVTQTGNLTAAQRAVQLWKIHVMPV